MKKKLLLFACLLLTAVSGWAAGYTATLSANYTLTGYKVKAFYNFTSASSLADGIVPTSGDLRQRDGWGIHNYGSGTRSATVNIPVSEGDILVVQVYAESTFNSISGGTKNESLSSSTGYIVYNMTADAESETWSVFRYGGFVSAVVMEIDDSQTYQCTATDNLGNSLASTEVTGGGDFTFYLPYFVFQEGKFYQNPILSAGTLSYAVATVSNIAANTDVIVTYTEEENTKVVYYSEAENISGLTSYEDNNVNARMSNGKAGYATTDKTVITNLPAGTYTITAATRLGSTTFYAGSGDDATTLLTLTSTGSVVATTSDAFTLTEATDITISAGGNRNYFDYIIIRSADAPSTEPTEPSAYYTPSAGLTDNTTAWWTNFSDSYTIEDGKMANFKFYNYNSNGNNWNNFLFVAATNGTRDASQGYSEYFCLRADNYGWGTYYNADGLSNTFDWDNYNTHMNGALVDMNIAYYGGLIKMTSTITDADGTAHTYKYTSPTGITADDITVFFFAEAAHISQYAPACATMKVTDAQYGTFVAPFPAHIPSGITAYTVDGVEADGYTLTLTTINSCIPANTPVVLQADAATTATVYGDKIESANLTYGLLTGVLTDTPAITGTYVLQNHEGVVGFYKVETAGITTVKANRAYLTAPEDTDIKAFTFGNTDAIQAIEVLTSGDAKIYDLNGRQLNKLQKGINIVNGHKILVK